MESTVGKVSPEMNPCRILKGTAKTYYRRKRPETIKEEDEEDEEHERQRQKCEDEKNTSSSPVQDNQRFFRCIFEENSDMIICVTTSSNMNINFISPNSLIQSGSALSLVAPESRGQLSRALFETDTKKVIRLRVRANDGRMADALILSSQNEEIILALFYLQKIDQNLLNVREKWTENTTKKMAFLGTQLVVKTNFCAAVQVNEFGTVISSTGRSIPSNTNPIDLIIPNDRRRVVQSLAHAKATGNKIATSIHSLLEDLGQVFTTCFFNEQGGALIFVYTLCESVSSQQDCLLATQKSQSPSFEKRRFRATNEEMKNDNALAMSLERHLSLLETYRSSSSGEREDVSQHKRKRVPSQISLQIPAPPPTPDQNYTKPPRHFCNDDDEWGHFVFPENEPGFNLPPVIHDRPRLKPDTTAQPKCIHHHYNAPQQHKYRKPFMVPAFSPTLLPTLPPQYPINSNTSRQEASIQSQPPPKNSEEAAMMLIDLDAVLPRQQSIENYEKEFADIQTKQCSTQNYNNLDNILETVLPRPESITAFENAMQVPNANDVTHEIKLQVPICSSSSSSSCARSIDESFCMQTQSAYIPTKNMKRQLSGNFVNYSPPSRRRHLLPSSTQNNSSKRPSAFVSAQLEEKKVARSTRPRVHIVG